MKRNYFLLFLFLVAAPLFAQLDRSKLPAAGPAPEINIGNYESFEMPNGLKVFVVENHKLPRVTFSLILDRDPILEGANAGYVSAAGELLRTGTKTRTKDKLDEEIDFLGASLNTTATGINASGLTKNREKLFAIMSDIILNSDFKQEELDKIIKQTLSELATTKDDPNAIAGRVQSVLVYGKDHPYGEPETDNTVKSISLEMCKNYYNTYFKPNIAYLAIVGDINKAQAKSLVEKYLGKWAKGEVPAHTYPTPKAPLIDKVALVDRSNSVQSVITVCYPVDLKIGTDDAIKASIVNLILGGSATGRLFMNLRESKAYTYGAYSSLNPDELIGSFGASASVRNSVTDSALTEILSEMKKIRTEKVGDDELKKAENYLTGGFIRRLEAPATVAQFAINTARYNLDKNYYKNYLKKLNSVTSDEVLATAKKYIKPGNSYLLIVGNGDEVADKLKRFSMSGKIDYYDAYGDSYDPSMKKLPEGITAKSVIDKYIEAIGGKDNLLKVNDKTTVMKGSIQGMNLTLTISQKQPGKLYQLLDAGVFQQKTVFDGTKGKVSGMNGEQELTGSMLENVKSQADMHSILTLDEKGVKTELAGVESINGKDAYKINFTYPSGLKATNYYDSESGLLVRTLSAVDTPQGSINMQIDFDDYRDVNGVKYPFKLTQTAGPNVIELTAESIEVNKGLDDAMFEVK